MSTPNSTLAMRSAFRGRFAFGSAALVLVGSVLVTSASSSATTVVPQLQRHAHVAHWLSAKPAAVSAHAIHQTFVVDSSFDPAVNTSGCVTHHTPGTCTLRSAIYAANNDGNHVDAVTIPVGRHLMIYPYITISTSVVINGAGAFLNSEGGEAFYITSNAAVTINGLHISGGSATSGGGIDCNSGALVLSSVNMNHNVATADGGAIYQNRTCNLWIDNSTFTNNSATGDGGVLYLLGNAYISRSTFGGNSSSLANVASNGAAIYNGDGAVIMTGVTVKHNFGSNSAFAEGIGIYNDESMDISNSAISYNSTNYGGRGAGIENQYNLTVSNSFINNNSISGGVTDSSGAGIYNNAYVLNLVNDTMTGNSIHIATHYVYGAALYSEGGTTNWTGGSVTGSQAINDNGYVYGGAVSLSPDAENTNIVGVSISATTARAPGYSVYGGALYLDSPGNMTNDHISATTTSAAYVYGGALQSYADWTFTGLTVAATNAHASSPSGSAVEGGAIYLDDYSVMTSVTITNTTAIADLGGSTFSGIEADVFGSFQ